ncbi:ATP-grasp domain-containing protein [Streptomyces sp. NPDC058683]|uniref:ATP-grasp domain-containing protein n=1 Tax=Streptomyces sp. NPDC058683 TaxID=3346597 RepID=UPI00365AE828
MRLVVTGTGGASGYAVALQAEQLGYEVLWADADPLCPALLANPGRAQLLPLASEGIAYLEALAKAARSFGATCVSFNTDAEVRYAAGQVDALSELGLTQWLPSPGTVRLCSDKAEFANHLSRNSRFCTPTSFAADDLVADFPAAGVFVKRRSGSGGLDSMVCSRREELEAWLHRNTDGLIQEVLTGQEFSADCLYTGSDPPLVVARRRLRIRSGMSVVTETFQDPLLEELVAGLVQELQVVGPSCVQGFLQPDGVVFTETNVRFGGGCAAAFWGATHLVEQYLALLTSGERRLPEGLHGRRMFSRTTLVRVPGYSVLQAGSEPDESAALDGLRMGENQK